MYAVVFQVDVNESWDSDPQQDLDQLVAFAKTLPGFIRGTWTADGQSGLSFLLFDSEDAARSVATAPVPPDGPMTLRSVDVFEVLRDV